MLWKRPYVVVVVLAALAAVLLASCSNARMPEFSFGPEPLPQIPYSVTLEFADSVRDARLEAPACWGETWEGHLGHALATNFLKISSGSFKQVTLAPEGYSPERASSNDSDLTIQVFLESGAFDSSSQTADSPQYSAVLRIELVAVVIDADGKPLGKVPLSHQKRSTFSLTPPGNPTRLCATGQLDDAMEDASEYLAREMVIGVATWAGTYQQQTGTVASAPAKTAPLAAAGAGPVVFQATLLDENNNVILEAGERVGLRVDITNAGADPIASASITLAGTSAIVDAFATTLGAPMEVGPLGPGETKSTVFWGKMPDELEEQRGELVVSVFALSTSTSQTLVSAISPSSAPGSTTVSPQPQARPATRGRPPTGTNRYAVIIGLDQYRDPWPQARTAGPEANSRLTGTLKSSAGLPDDHVLILRNEHATKLDMVEAVLKWLPDRINDQSVLFFFVSAEAVVDADSGEVYLIPYEGTPGSSTRRLVSLHALQGSLKRMKAKLALLFLDTPVSRPASKAISKQARGAKQDWKGVIERPREGRPVRLVQIVASSPSRTSGGGLAAGLNGKADRNGDGQVTLGELLDDVQAKARVYPSLARNAPERAIVLSGGGG